MIFLSIFNPYFPILFGNFNHFISAYCIYLIKFVSFPINRIPHRQGLSGERRGRQSGNQPRTLLQGGLLRLLQGVCEAGEGRYGENKD